MFKFITSALLVFLLFGINTKTSADTIAIKVGTMIDPASEQVLENQIIIVEDDKIISIGPAHGIEPVADRIIDLSNSCVLPGLMDAHVHLTADTQYRNVDFHSVYAKNVTINIFHSFPMTFHSLSMILCHTPPHPL